jgi:hypothetical protein
MSMINRCAVTIKAKEPFVKWLNSLPDALDIKIDIDRVNQETSVYLLQEYDYDDERESLLEHFYDLIFDEQLSSWWEAEEDWPARRTLSMFKQWFDVEFHSMVIDCVDAPLERQE